MRFAGLNDAIINRLIDTYNASDTADIADIADLDNTENTADTTDTDKTDKSADIPGSPVSLHTPKA